MVGLTDYAAGIQEIRSSHFEESASYKNDYHELQESLSLLKGSI